MTSPNVVLIVVDDMGFGDFGRFGDGRPRTPALDQLVDTGMTFTQYYSASPVCAPARAAMMTGRYAQRTGAIDTLEARGTDRIALREATLADELIHAGYATGLVGKWHNGAIGQSYHPNARGFSEFVGFRGGWSDYWNWSIERNGTALEADGRYLTDVFTDESVSFIRRHQDEPFFLQVAYNAPHFPFQAPEALVEEFGAQGLTTPIATIYAMISAMDRGVERIMNELALLGLDENTIVAFTSDNGPQLDRDSDGAVDRYNFDLKGEKQYVWEGGIRLPLIMRWPAVIAPGERNESFVHATDLLPTLLDLARVDRRGDLPLDGRSFAAALIGEHPVADIDRFWQWTRYAPAAESNAAVRSGRWKLVFPALSQTMGLDAADKAIDEAIKTRPQDFLAPKNWPVPDYSELEPAAPRLFDLQLDPAEAVDVAEDRPELVRTLSASLASWFEDVEGERRSFAD